jgi:rhodanese-related sulfurtransferase
MSVATISTINPDGLRELIGGEKEIDLIDVRTPAEYRAVHVAKARNIPLDQLDPKSVISSRKAAADQPIYLICQGGTRAKNACEKFIQAGFTDVVNVEGGTKACTEQGLPVVRGKQAMSLERQVRIAAGSLVLLGVILGLTVHPGFFGLAAFVGAGLVFAGITDTCGMGMLLARMPWNQDHGGSCSTASYGTK